MKTLHIRLFGGATFYIDSQCPIHVASQRSILLLAYLSLNLQPHSRDELASLLWDHRTKKQALANLRTLLNTLPESIKPYLIFTQRTIQIDAKHVWVDVLTFQDQTKELMSDSIILTPTLVANLIDVQKKSHGIFLEGITVKDSLGLDEWVMLIRERLHHLHFTVLYQLTRYYFHQRQTSSSLHYARLLVQFDPVREDSYHWLMRALARNGQRVAALQQYHVCEQMLQNEFGLQPHAKTQALYQRLRVAPQTIPYVLPQQPMSFVGRETEQVQLHEWLDRPESHLITILGLGGAGKSRLATHIAETRRGDYLHGIYFVSFVGVTDEHDFIVTLAYALGIRLRPFRIEEQIYDFLYNKEILLILDNFDSLTKNQTVRDFLTKVKTKASTVQTIVTSRQKLNIAHEQILRLGGLSLAGVTLFLERAEQATGMALEYTEHVALLCQLMDNLPLGIELAASALMTHSLPHVVSQIQKNLDILNTRYHDTPARHQSIRAAFAYSWENISEQQQNVLQRCAVFQGGFSLIAAQQVAFASREILTDFVWKSLLQKKNDRYTLHPLLKQYILETLEEVEPFELAHHQYYLKLLVMLDIALKDHRQLETLQRLGDDILNIRWAWCNGLQRLDPLLLYEAAPVLARLHAMRSWYRAGHVLFTEALNYDWEPKVNGRFHALLGAYTFILGDNGLAKQQLQSAIQQLPPNAPDIPFIYNFLGEIARWENDYESASQYYETAQLFAEQLNDWWERLFAIGGQADMFRLSGDYKKSIQYIETTLPSFPQGEVWMNMTFLASLGVSVYRLGEYNRAKQLFTECMSLAQKMGDKGREAALLTNMGLVLDATGNYAKALQCYKKANEINLWVGDRYGVMMNMLNRGLVFVRLGHYDKAHEQLQEAQFLATTLNDKRQIGFVLCGLSHIALWSKNMTTALAYLQEAMALYVDIHDKRGIGWCYLNLGEFYLQQDDLAQAKTHAEQGLLQLQAIEHHWGVLHAQWLLAEIARRNDNVTFASFEAILQQAKELLPIALRVLLSMAQTESPIRTDWLQIVVEHPATEYHIRMQAQVLFDAPIHQPLDDPDVALQKILTKLSQKTAGKT